MLTLADRNSKSLYAAKTESRDSRLMTGAFKKALGGCGSEQHHAGQLAVSSHGIGRLRTDITQLCISPTALPLAEGHEWEYERTYPVFFPKGTDFRKVTEEELQRVVSLINNRHRKCLGGKSPLDVFAKQCCT
jgi:IS30 family transposase